MTELERKDWTIKSLETRIDRSHHLLIALLADIGVGDGTVGWIEHADEDEALKRDSLSMDGELIFGFDAITHILKEKDDEIARLNSVIAKLNSYLEW